MKKKQLAKLKKQFRPSFESAQKMLFEAMTKKGLEKYNLPLNIFIKPTNHAEMAIELLEETTKDSIITVPLDNNFNTVVKRIQTLEKGLLDRFSENLIDEVASYWLSQPTKVVEMNPAPATTVEEKAEATVAEVVPTPTTEEAVATPAASGALAAFEEKIATFPKFFVKQEDAQVSVFEKTAKEDRLLATISMEEANTFEIAPALERKYKLKLEVIPVIEDFAQTAIADR